MGLKLTKRKDAMSFYELVEYELSRKNFKFIKGGKYDGLDYIRARIKRNIADQRKRTIEAQANINPIKK
jgi:hypothetical protein